AVKMAIQKGMEAGAKGVKVQVSGRLNGVEISRREYFKDGNVPLHTLRADIDFAKVNAYTTYGVIGIKVWVYKGLVFGRRGEFTSSAAIKEKQTAQKMEAMKDQLNKE
ncbi:MAG: 30S ribosomal protein S3, partial [Candidatus Peregrinibacteria bacterium]